MSCSINCIGGVVPYYVIVDEEGEREIIHSQYVKLKPEDMLKIKREYAIRCPECFPNFKKTIQVLRDQMDKSKDNPARYEALKKQHNDIWDNYGRN